MIAGAFVDEYKPNRSFKEDCDSGETVSLSPTAKRYRKSTGEKGKVVN